MSSGASTVKLLVFVPLNFLEAEHGATIMITTMNSNSAAPQCSTITEGIDMGIAVGPSKRTILSTRPQQFIAKAVATEIIVYWCRLPIGPHQQLHVTSALISPLEQWLLHLSSPGLPLHPNSNRLPSVAPQRYTLPILSTNNPRGFL